MQTAMSGLLDAMAAAGGATGWISRVGTRRQVASRASAATPPSSSALSVNAISTGSVTGGSGTTPHHMSPAPPTRRSEMP